jgi:LysR family glycine cleavage system transcriptional activator
MGIDRKGPRRRLPLTALRTFEAAARLESFKDAAQELGVSATTVSNQIRMLEREWRCQLFIRKTRRVILTETGQALGRVVGRSFDAIAREIDFHVTTARHSVSMAVGSIFGALWLMPRLMKLRRDLPRIDLSLRRGRRVTSASDMPASIVVDWGLGEWPGLEAEPLLRIRYAPVLAPALLRTAGGIQSPRDLARFPAIHQQDRSEWTTWLQLVGASEMVFAEETIIEDSNIATQAAVAGQGVALGIFPFVQDDVDAGRLVKPFAAEMAPTRAYYILTRPGARRRPEIAAVCDWLQDEARAYAARYLFTKFARGAIAAAPLEATLSV